MKLIKYYFLIICGDESCTKVEEIHQNCYSLFLDYQSQFSLGEITLISSSEHAFGHCDRNEVEKDPFDDFDKFVASNAGNLASK